jgi:hypothetical protein
MIELNYARRAERRAVNILCDVVAREWEAPFSHRATDLSPFGMWLQTSFPLRVGDVVVLSFKPPTWSDTGDLTVFAEVTRRVKIFERHGVRRNGMGLEFLDLSDEERGRLRGWLRHKPSAERRHGRSIVGRLFRN